MIKKLRRKFILISALSVFFVLAITMSVINISNYISIENDASASLSEIINQGPAPKEEPMPNNTGDPNDGNQPEGNPPSGDRPERMLRESYFVASFNQDGTINKIESQIRTMEEAKCRILALKVYNHELTGGKYYDYRFKMGTKADGVTCVAFVDFKERLDSFRHFLLLSSTISVGAYAALIVLIVIGSKIAFKSSEEAYLKQKRFITNASHEIKTPITVISADLDLIEMDSGKNEWSQSIRDQLKRLTEMTNQLVTLSKLDEGDLSRFPLADFSLNEVCNPIVDSYKPLFKKEKIKFAYNITGNLTMYGNKGLIDDLIRVFLDNSLKYTDGDNKSSYFVVGENRGKIEFRFSNTINKDDETDTKQIMERFYRSPSNKKEGSGVGLSIAQEIINIHKGKITVEKNTNVISFTIKFN